MLPAGQQVVAGGVNKVLLVEPDWLNGHAGGAGLVSVDVRSREDYLKGCDPVAVSLPITQPARSGQDAQ
jgi:hypothetical protein